MTDWYSKIQKMEGAILADALPSVKDSLLELPTPSLNWALGGGLVFGKILTVYGPEQSGKSLIAQLAIAKLHAEDPEAFAVWYDAEFSFDSDYAKKLGIDTKRVILKQTNKPSEIFDHFADELWPMMQEGFPLKIAVLDSVKALRGPREADAASVENHIIGDVSGLLNKAFRKIIEPIRKHGVLWICVQQVNEEMDQQRQMYGYKWRVPSGQALKHMSDYMVLVEKVEGKKTKTFDETHKTIQNLPMQLGHRIRCKIDKNRVNVPHLTAEFQLKYGVGVVDIEQEIAELAVNQQVVDHKKGTTGYAFGGDKAVGFAKFVELVRSKPELQRELIKALNSKRDNELFAKHQVEVVSVVDKGEDNGEIPDSN